MVNEKIKTFNIKLLNFYQKFLTVFSYGSCKYIPTCSEYAKWQFENNNILLAFYYSLGRILKCNQFFEGGFDYPHIKKDFKTIYKKNFLKLQDIKYWYIPTKNNDYIIIKNWDFKNGN
jgi:putative membrane protein insertion efficiency factor